MNTAPSARLHFRKVFVVALVAGTSAIGTGQYSNSASVSVAGPMVVMALYLAIGIRYAENGDRAEQFADSVYYLGFLFTLIALSASLLAYQSIQIEFNLLVANFALALVTTIFGLAARIVLVNFQSAQTDRTIVQDILDRQTEKLCQSASRISRDLESLSREIGEHHKVAMEENRLRMEATYRSLETLSEKAACSVERIAVSATAQMSQTLSELRGRLESSHFPEDLFAAKLDAPIARFAEKLDEAGNLLGELQNRQKIVSENMRTASEAIHHFEQRIAALNASFDGLNQQLEIDLNAKQNLVELARSMSDIVASSTSVTQEIQTQAKNSRQIVRTLHDIFEQMNRIPAEVDVTNSAIRQSTRTLIKSTTVLASHSGTIREQLDGFSKELAKLHNRFSGLNTLSGKIDKTAESLAKLVETLESRPGSLSGLERSTRDQLAAINRHQQELERILSQSRVGLEDMTNQFVRAVEYVTDKLRA